MHVCTLILILILIYNMWLSCHGCTTQHETYWLLSLTVALTITEAWSSASEFSFFHLLQLEWRDIQHSLNLLKVGSCAGLLVIGTVESESDLIGPMLAAAFIVCFHKRERWDTRRVAYVIRDTYVPTYTRIAGRDEAAPRAALWSRPL